MGREREDFAAAVNEAGRQSNTADLAAGLADTSAQLGQVSAELHEERLWRKRYGRGFIVVVVVMVIALVGLGIAVGVLIDIARTNEDNGRVTRDNSVQMRCTQDFIVDLVNPASELRAKLRANEPITNPCR